MPTASVRYNAIKRPDSAVTSTCPEQESRAGPNRRGSIARLENCAARRSAFVSGKRGVGRKCRGPHPSETDAVRPASRCAHNRSALRTSCRRTRRAGRRGAASVEREQLLVPAINRLCGSTPFAILPRRNIRNRPDSGLFVRSQPADLRLCGARREGWVAPGLCDRRPGANSSLPLRL